MARSETAASIGRKGGQAKTPAQQEARRTNGAKGGRPRKLFRLMQDLHGYGTDWHVVSKHKSLKAARSQFDRISAAFDGGGSYTIEGPDGTRYSPVG
jgi:hypothetical protein